MDRRLYYSPKDLLQILESPRNCNEKYCWELNSNQLLRKFQENVIQAVSVDFATSALVLQSAAKHYALRTTSLDRDTVAYKLRLSSLSRIEQVIEQDRSNSTEPEQENPAPVGPVVVLERLQIPAKPVEEPKPAEEPTVDPITGEIVVVPPPVVEKPPPVKKPPKPIDINIYLEQLFAELQKTLNHFDPESVSNSIFTVVDRQLRLKCCDILLKYLNEPIPLMEVLRKFLNDEDPDLVLKPIEHKRFLATKMMLLVDVRNDVFIPNLSMQDDMLEIRVSLKEYILEEIIRLTCYEDCLPHDDANLPQDEAQIVVNGTLDSGIDQNSTINEATSLENEIRNNVSSTDETAFNRTTDSENISGTQETSEIQDSEIPVSTQDSGFLSGTQESSIFATQNSEMISATQETGCSEDVLAIDHSSTKNDENTPNDETVNKTLSLEDVEDEIQHSVEDTESLLIDCEAIRECQETATSMTVNNVQFKNIFGLSKRVLRKKSFFRLPDYILEWARIHKNLDLKIKQSNKDPKKRDFKMKPKNQKVLTKFINKNRRSSINKLHLDKLSNQCFVQLSPLQSENQPQTSILPTEDTILPPGNTQETTNPVEDGLITAQELSGTSLNEIFENNLLSSTSCFDDESGVERHYEDDIETDSYKTLTHYSNVESGIFTDMTTRDNTPSCNATRNNSFFSEYHDDITNMTSTTPLPTQINRALFDRFDVATKQLQEVPEGNVLNQIAEKMQDYQEKERQLLEMYQRVDKWHQSILERLVHAKRRENWDVIVYEDKILKKVPEQPETIHFALIVSKKTHEEIGRDFLATLILANEGNIIISKTNEDPWSVNNFTLSKSTKILRNHEIMNDRMQKITSVQKCIPSTSFAQEIPHQLSEKSNPSQISFLHRLYSTEQSDDEDMSPTGTKSDDQTLLQNVNNLLNYYDSDQEEFQPEARLNIEYDRPVPQTVRRRGRIPKVQPKRSDKNVYSFNNKEYDSSDLDNYVARIARNVDAFEERSKSQEVIVNRDLPVVLRAPGSKRTLRNDIPTSPKTKLSISKRNELNESRRRFYSSSEDDDNLSLSELYTARRPPAKRKAPEKQMTDSNSKRLKILDRQEIREVDNSNQRIPSSNLKRKTPEKNTIDSYLKRFKIFDDAEPTEIVKRRLSKSNDYERPSCIATQNSKTSRISDNYAIAGPSGLQRTQKRTYTFISDDDDYSSSDSECNKLHQSRSLLSGINATSTPYNKKSNQHISLSTYGNSCNLSQISLNSGLFYDSDS